LAWTGRVTRMDGRMPPDNDENDRTAWATLRALLPSDYQDPAWSLPPDVERGSEPHLAYLTLAYTLSGGREQVSYWEAARRRFAADRQLFEPRFLAYAKPDTLVERLREDGLASRLPSEATVWQRIGQALVMRARGSVSTLLAHHRYDAGQLMTMLGGSKTTFPVLSGPQTAPRWLYGLATVGQQPIGGAAELLVPISPAMTRYLRRLDITADSVPAVLFGPLVAWESQRK
jgi:hypothetical protein